jgi:hypothetical protein
MSLTIGDSNKTLRVNAGFNMSTFTELTLNFILPDSTTATKATADGVVIGSGVVDDDLGTLTANEYVEYPTEAGFLSLAGTWSVYLTFTDTATTPDTIYNSPCVSFTVQDVC